MSGPTPTFHEVSAELLGTLERVVHAAVRIRGTYKKRSDDTHRAFGGREHRHVCIILASTSPSQARSSHPTLLTACRLCTPRVGTVLAVPQRQCAVILSVDRSDEV